MKNPIPNRFNTTEITFYTASPVKAGTPVLINSDGHAVAAEKGFPFIGICTKVDGNYATVAVAGIVTTGFTGEIGDSGYQLISADGQGNVKLDFSSAHEYRVLAVDKEAKTVTIIL